ncbi:patatin-like phospholipase family protein [Desulfuribacillus alkaliarsenatis]|uniref:Patatin n=1 Tax=Desulfuribacillus alkaliarsenatis TaxID=766136 RepID=A0A1E5G526_9FIRM|nr:patatin-like phospholipase family protein [Desulfuribacillus alkaliarsenatis]OEF98280.1 patatin [Desulfuribacillus alkaliarsenatis]
MRYPVTNMVFEGGGVLGIAYLGVLDYLYSQGVFQNVKRVAGTSAGAITACVSSFNLPFNEIKAIADSLDYRKVPQSKAHSDLKHIPAPIKHEIDKLFGDVNSIYRIVKNYGWYSTDYFYHWLQEQIANQFDSKKKKPPYTFRDFQNTDIHRSNRTFKDLYIIGTNISYKTSKVFSYETTPDMEVAEAVRISMSIPLFFEAVKTTDPAITAETKVNVFCDGGVMDNYPINTFDYPRFNETKHYGFNVNTLGARFKSKVKYSEITNILSYIKNLNLALTQIQQDIYNHSPYDQARSIVIDTKDVSSTDFNISPHDATYNFLYSQGYLAAKGFYRQ